MDWSSLDSSNHGILQARMPEWIASSFSNKSCIGLLKMEGSQELAHTKIPSKHIGVKAIKI